MFSPSMKEGGPATATRSRRRQRPSSSDSLMLQPKAKRQRVPLNEQTFVNPDAPAEMFEVKSDKVAKLPLKHHAERIEKTTSAVPKQDLTVRSKKPRSGERISKGDGSVVLTTNNAYTVSKLPALPDRIRADVASRQHGTLFSSSGHALCLTHTHAFVWPYTGSTPCPETFVFNLDYPSRHSSDPLPLGSLVPPASSSDDPGLIVVMPISGKITYWESISSAATLTFMRQQRNGLEASIPGMFSGEHVIDVVNVEPAGFVLAFGSGRLAHLSVRDGHGRPAISVQFLRSALAQGTGGFLGSIRNVLKQSAVRGDLAAVRAGPHVKLGERNVVAATAKGKITVWRISRGGNHYAIAELNVRDDVVRHLRGRLPVLDPAPLDSFEILDIVFAPKLLELKSDQLSQVSNVDSAGDADSVQHLLLLVTMGEKTAPSFAVVEAVIENDQVDIGMVRPVTSYSSPVSKVATVRPRLYAPNPGSVAFIVFDRAVVVTSLAVPAQQLADGTGPATAAFEDVIDLRDQDTLEIVGSGLEEPLGGNVEHEAPRVHRHKTKGPGALLMVRGVGVVRVAISDIDRFGTETAPRLTAKSKLEQAVFFGIKDDNPLAFDGRRRLDFSSEEIGKAALQLSYDILGSESPYLLHVPALLEANLRTRASYLDRLMLHLNTLNVDLDRETRWALLWNAEKMTVSAQIWKLHEQFLADRDDEDKKSIVAEIVEFIHEDEKKVPDSVKGELDRVRHWFTHDVRRLERFVAWAYELIKHIYTREAMADAFVTRLLYEAMTVMNEALRGAYEYRQKKMPFYGLQNEEMDKGVLAGGYEALPCEPWTSSYYITNNARRLMELCHKWLASYYPPQGETPDPGLLESIREGLPSLTDMYLLTLLEHSRWASSRSNQKTLRYGNTCRNTYEQDRYEKVVQLKDLGLWTQAIEVAEKHQSTHALAELMVEETNALKRIAAGPDVAPGRSAELRERAKSRREGIGKLFPRHGDKFAFAVFEIVLREEGVRAVLEFPNKGDYATKFLRTKPELSKISWINDIEEVKDVDHAAETLIELGTNREQQLWSKKIELSLGKLALLAEARPPPSTGRPTMKQLISRRDEEEGARKAAGVQKVDRELAVIKIQDKLYGLLLPTVSQSLDETGALELVMECHSGNIPRNHKALLRFFEDGLGRLLRHEALDTLTLIDLLTLVSVKVDPMDPGFDVLDDLFFNALRVVQLALHGEQAQNATRLIWRRCFIRDNWALINNTQAKDDAAMSGAIGETAAYLTAYAINSYKHRSDKNFSPFVRPSEALGVYVDSLDSRFDCLEDGVKHKILEAMKSEDAELTKYVDKHRMDHWYQTTLTEAHKALQHDVDEATREAVANAQVFKSYTNGNGNGSGTTRSSLFLNGNAV